MGSVRTKGHFGKINFAHLSTLYHQHTDVRSSWNSISKPLFKFERACSPCTIVFASAPVASREERGKNEGQCAEEALLGGISKNALNSLKTCFLLLLIRSASNTRTSLLWCMHAVCIRCCPRKQQCCATQRSNLALCNRNTLCRYTEIYHQCLRCQLHLRVH